MTDNMRQLIIATLNQDVAYLKGLLAANLPHDIQDRILGAKRLETTGAARTVADIVLDALNTTRSSLLLIEAPNLVL